MASNAELNFLVERLVKTVARAFYTDTYIVVFDALLREKYIKESELGPRLRLKERDVKAILNQLENVDLLVKFESLLVTDLDGRNRQHKYYYIDYQMFVDVIRYRIHLMRKKIDPKGPEASEQISNFKCPTCLKVITLLEAMKSPDIEQNFVCTSCCPHDNFRGLSSELWFRLQSQDGETIAQGLTGKNATNARKKFDACMGESHSHDSIYELLTHLAVQPVGTNKPSLNMRLGFSNSEVDADVRTGISEGLGRSVVQKKNRYLIEEDIKEAQSKDTRMVEVHLENGETKKRAVYDDFEAGSGPGGKKIKRATHVPDFLTRSGVTGAEEVYQLESLRASTAMKAGFSSSSASSTGVVKAQAQKSLVVSSLGDTAVAVAVAEGGDRSTVIEKIKENEDGSGSGSGKGEDKEDKEDGEEEEDEDDDDDMVWED